MRAAQFDLVADEARLAEEFKRAQARSGDPSAAVQTISSDQLNALANSNINNLKKIARLEKLARESGKIFLFGSNALLQLGGAGAERKLLPYEMKFAKSRSIIYLHAELTSTFAISVDKKMYVWGSSPLNPNQHLALYQMPEPVNSSMGLSTVDIENLQKQRNQELARQKIRDKEVKAASKLVRIVPEFEALAIEKELTREEIEMLPHEFIPPWDTKTEPVVWLACGVEHVCGVTSLGRVFTYGSGVNGRLGHGEHKNLVKPKFISLKTNLTGDAIIAAHCGADFTVLRTKRGRLLTFGCGEHSQLGHGDNSDRNVPTMIPKLDDHVVVDVGVGAHHCIALTSTGMLLSWGLNNLGQCGQGHLEVVSTPTFIEHSREKPRKVDANLGQFRTKHKAEREKKIEKAKKAAAKAKASDESNPFYHQQIEESSDSSEYSFSSDNLEKWKAAKELERQTAASKGMTLSAKKIKDNENEEKKVTKKWDARKLVQKKLDAMKDKAEQEKDSLLRTKLEAKYRKALEKQQMLRDKRQKQREQRKLEKKRRKRAENTHLADTHDLTYYSIFKRKDKLRVPRNFVAIKCGSLFSAAITEDGRLYTWGDNSEGQLGLGNRQYQKIPTLVQSLLSHCIIQVACGRKHTLALTAHGKVFAWGTNNEGQLGVGHRQQALVPVEVVALRSTPIALISCGLDHSVCLEGARLEQKAKTRKFLTKQEMDAEVRKRRKQQEEDKKGNKKGKAMLLEEEIEKELVLERHKHIDHDDDDTAMGVRSGVVMVDEKKHKGLSAKSKRGLAMGAGLIAIAAVTMAAATLN